MKVPCCNPGHDHALAHIAYGVVFATCKPCDLAIRYLLGLVELPQPPKERTRD